jgi:hypothetical protein
MLSLEIESLQHLRDFVQPLSLASVAPLNYPNNSNLLLGFAALNLTDQDVKVYVFQNQQDCKDHFNMLLDVFRSEAMWLFFTISKDELAIS